MRRIDYEDNGNYFAFVSFYFGWNGWWIFGDSLG